MSIHGSTRAPSGSGTVAVARSRHGSRGALLHGAKAVLVLGLVLGAATACNDSSDDGSHKAKDWKVGDCAGPDTSESKDGFEAMDCDDSKATIKALAIKDGAIFAGSIQCPAGTDEIISVKVSYGGNASTGIPTKTICGRNLSGDHPGDAGAGGGQLVKGDCVDEQAKEVACGSGGSGVYKVLDLTKTAEDCPAGTDEPLELFPSVGRPYNAICTTKA
ncbi:hypothetical protein AB0L71_05210 [Streptomyces sp. NPDC052052]|uniref:hypothetical protein n=1 Tax=Streptomyces sp. NPDC052052 TaxID=3154756 RepID=UPI003447EB40